MVSAASLKEKDLDKVKSNKFAVEHCQAKFLNADGRENFIKVFESLTKEL